MPPRAMVARMAKAFSTLLGANMQSDAPGFKPNFINPRATFSTSGIRSE